MDAAQLTILEKALAEHGVALKSFTEKMAARLVEVEQRMSARHGRLEEGGAGSPGELTELVMKSDALQAFTKGMAPSVTIQVPSRLLKTAIANTGSVIAAPDRRPEIVAAPQRRFTIRNLLPAVPTTSNAVDFTREIVFADNAAPQYDSTSPDPHQEGAAKAESGITFELAQANVKTLAHWIPASRQILSDAPALQAHIEGRLLYGLDLEEERELLNGTDTNGELDGLISNATAFAGGSTNLTALDAVALGLGQLIASDYTPSGIVLPPSAWFSSKFLTAKDSDGNYILGNPASMTEPRLWGLPVSVSGSMPANKFLVLDGQRAATIYDREEAVIRISESHQDWFVRNMVAILAEKRLTLAVQLGAAMVYGDLSHAG